jgi:hypothetical protein
VLRLRGGYEDPSAANHNRPTAPSEPEMGVAAGGLIRQAIVRDPGDVKWDPSQTKVFNVQILNSHHFTSVTGFAPPPTPIDARSYASSGFPFYTTHEEPSSIAGDFSSVRSVGQIEGTSEPELVRHGLVNLVRIPRHSYVSGDPFRPRQTRDVGFFNPTGSTAPFQTLAELETSITSRGQTVF